MVSILLVAALIVIGVPVLIKVYFTLIRGRNKHFPDMRKKVVLVTGGNAGIGKETARLLYQLNATVIITGRDKEKAQAFLEQLPMHTPQRPKMKFYQVDFSDLNQVKQFAEEIKTKYNKIDILVNNAAMANLEHRLSKQGIELTMAVNHLAPVYLTSLLMDLLVDAEGRQARIINVSSKAHITRKKLFAPFLKAGNLWNTKINTQETGSMKYFVMTAYGLSKLGNVAFTRGLAQLIKKNNWSIKTASLHPGGVNTDIWRPMDEIPIIKNHFKPLVLALMRFALRTEAEGAATIQHLSLCPFDEIVNGEYYIDCEVSRKQNYEDLEKYTQYLWDETIKVIYEKTGHRCFSGKKEGE